MKRKDYSGWDPALVDAGWKQMKSDLDREMPEKKRWRAFIWWPILAAASVAGFFLITLPNGLGELDHQSSEKALTIIESPESKFRLSNETLNQDDEVEITIETVNTKAQLKSGRTVLKEESKFFVSEVTFSPVKSRINHPESKTLSTREIPILPSLLIENTELSYINELDRTTLFGLIQHSPQLSIEPDRIKAQKDKPELTPGIAVGGGAYLPFTNISWIIGPSVEVSWKKVFLSSALEFWNINTRKSFLLNESTQAFYEVEKTRNTSSQDMTGVVQPGGEGNSEYHVDQIQYLKTSIRAGYITANRVSPFIGISTIFLLNDKIPFAADRSTSNFSSSTSAMTGKKDILRTSNFAVDIGVNYRLNSKFILSLNYTHPWHSYLKPEYSYASLENITRQFLMGIHFQFD